MTKFTLMVLAVGSGSCYGCLKQKHIFFPRADYVIDVFTYDVLRACFNNIVVMVGKSSKNVTKKYVVPIMAF